MAALLGLSGAVCWLVADTSRLVTVADGRSAALLHGCWLAGVLLLAWARRRVYSRLT